MASIFYMLKFTLYTLYYQKLKTETLLELPTQKPKKFPKSFFVGGWLFAGVLRL